MQSEENVFFHLVDFFYREKNFDLTSNKLQLILISLYFFSQVLDIFEKLLNDFERIKNKSAIDHMNGSVQYIYNQNKLLKQFLCKEQHQMVVLLIWDHLVKV